MEISSIPSTLPSGFPPTGTKIQPGAPGAASGAGASQTPGRSTVSGQPAAPSQFGLASQRVSTGGQIPFGQAAFEPGKLSSMRDSGFPGSSFGSSPFGSSPFGASPFGSDPLGSYGGMGGPMGSGMPPSMDPGAGMPGALPGAEDPQQAQNAQEDAAAQTQHQQQTHDIVMKYIEGARG